MAPSAPLGMFRLPTGTSLIYGSFPGRRKILVSSLKRPD
jgi:hypothetical protein